MTIGKKNNGQPIDEIEFDYIKHIETLIKNADTAMYSAKQRGRNKVVQFS